MAFSDSDTSSVDMMSDEEEPQARARHTRQRSNGNFDNIVGTPRGMRNSWSSIGRKGSFSGKRKPENNLAQQVVDLDSSGSDGIPSYVPQCKRPPICPPSTPPAVKGTGIHIDFARRSSAGTSSGGSPINNPSKDHKSKLDTAPLHTDPVKSAVIPKLDLKGMSKPPPVIPTITTNPILGLAGGGDPQQSSDSKSEQTPSLNEVGDKMVFSEPGSPKNEDDCFSLDDPCNSDHPANDLTDIASSSASSARSSAYSDSSDLEDLSLPKSNASNNRRRRESPQDLPSVLAEKDRIISQLRKDNESLSERLHKSEDETRMVITKYAECMGKLSGEDSMLSPRGGGGGGSISQDKKITELNELMKTKDTELRQLREKLREVCEKAKAQQREAQETCRDAQREVRCLTAQLGRRDDQPCNDDLECERSKYLVENNRLICELSEIKLSHVWALAALDRIGIKIPESCCVASKLSDDMTHSAKLKLKYIRACG